MKYYEIKQGKNGWVEATVVLKDGRFESYGWFYTGEEAIRWCYAKIRAEYGAHIANEVIEWNCKSLPIVK